MSHPPSTASAARRSPPPSPSSDSDAHTQHTSRTLSSKFSRASSKFVPLLARKLHRAKSSTTLSGSTVRGSTARSSKARGWPRRSSDTTDASDLDDVPPLPPSKDRTPPRAPSPSPTELVYSLVDRALAAAQYEEDEAYTVWTAPALPEVVSHAHRSLPGAMRPPPLALRAASLPVPNLIACGPSPEASGSAHATSPPAIQRAQSALHSMTPEQRARKRAEDRARDEMELAQAAADEAQRQARLKMEKHAELLQHARAEERRHAELARKLRAAALEREMREAAQEEEERQVREALARRRAEARQKRIEEGKRVAEWQREKERGDEAAVREREEAMARLERERRARANAVHAFDGWVTVQTEGTMAWRRRFCTLRAHDMCFFQEASGTLVRYSLFISVFHFVCG